MGESEEAVHRSLPTHEPNGPEENETALSLTMWLPLAFGPAAEQKQNETKDFPPGPPPGEGVALCSPSLEEEQFLASPGSPCQGCFVVFLEDLGAS